MDTAIGYARTLAKLPPSALTYTRRALQHATTATLEDQLAFEWSNQKASLKAPEFQEGIAAFREKRDPDYTKF